MQLTLSMNAEHECTLELFLQCIKRGRHQLYYTCTRSMNELLLEASEMFEMSQTMSSDSCTLLPTGPRFVDLSTFTCTCMSMYVMSTLSVVVFGCSN